MHTMIFALVIVTNAVTGGITFTAPEGRAICRADETGPSTVTVMSAPRGTPSDAFVECDYGEPSDVVKYSILSIKRELAALGKWDDVKSLLSAAGALDDVYVANYFASNDRVFLQFCTAVVERGMLTQEQLDELLPRCIWTAE